MVFLYMFTNYFLSLLQKDLFSLATVRKLGRPPALIMYIMDSVMILFQKRLQSVQVDPMRKFIKPSWEESLKVKIFHTLFALYTEKKK